MEIYLCSLYKTYTYTSYHQFFHLFHSKCVVHFIRHQNESKDCKRIFLMKSCEHFSLWRDHDHDLHIGSVPLNCVFWWSIFKFSRQFVQCLCVCVYFVECACEWNFYFCLFESIKFHLFHIFIGRIGWIKIIGFSTHVKHYLTHIIKSQM